MFRFYILPLNRFFLEDESTNRDATQENEKQFPYPVFEFSQNSLFLHTVRALGVEDFTARALEVYDGPGRALRVDDGPLRATVDPLNLAPLTQDSFLFPI